MAGRMVRIALALAAVLLAGHRLFGGEPAPMVYPPAAFYRPSAYDVWQNYGVDRQGRFKPLVVYSPFGAYYRYNGQPYPWVATHQREIIPTLSNQATFGGPATPWLIMPMPPGVPFLPQPGIAPPLHVVPSAGH